MTPLAKAGARLISFLFLTLLATLAVAHPSNVANATMKVAADGSFTLRLQFDVLAFALDQTPLSAADGAMNEILDATDATVQARLKETETRLRTGIDSGTTLQTTGFPTLAEVVAARGRESIRRLPVLGTATFSGKLPPGVRTIAIRFPASLDTVILTTEFPYQEPISEPVPGGEQSRVLPIPTDAQIAAAARALGVPLPAGSKPLEKVTKPRAAASASSPKKVSATPAVKNGGDPVPPKNILPSLSGRGGREADGGGNPIPPKGEIPSPPQTATVQPTADANGMPVPSTTVTTAPEQPAPSNLRNPLADLPRYVRLGFLHILPEGVDHILFVLGLVLVAVRTKDLLTQVSAFTVAHSLTLGLALFGIVRLPEQIVEPIIALSIAFVAIENIWSKKVGPWRLGAVFVFGLIHGLGFASALQEMGLARQNLLPALVGFNVGVELGQLTIVAAALGVLSHFRDHANYRKYVVIPASLAIAAIALFWTVERILPSLS